MVIILTVLVSYSSNCLDFKCYADEAKVDFGLLFQTGSVIRPYRRAGWLCNKCGEVRTFRRPPHNTCGGCRSCKRGRHNLKQWQGKNVAKDQTTDDSARRDQNQQPSSMPVSVRVRQKSSRAKAVSTPSCYDAMKSRLKQECEENLVPALGLTATFLAAAQAMAVVDRYRQSKLPLPACHRSLVSFSMAMSPIADEDLKRKLYKQHLGVKASVNRMRAGECMWAMTLPFNHQYKQPS